MSEIRAPKNPEPTPPLFSIITATYNAQDTLPATLKSIDEQTFTFYEHIIMDGASTDRTNALSCTGINPRRRFYSSPDHGTYDAMNKGLAEAKGTYVIFLNAGDAFHSPDTLQLLADAIIANDFPGVVYGQTDIVDSQRRRLCGRHLTAPEKLTYQSFAQGMLVCHQAFVALRQITARYNLRFRFSADYDWCIRVLQHSRYNLYVPAVIIDYLNEGLTTRNRFASLRERFRIMCYYYGTWPTIARHFKFIPRFLKRRKLENKVSREVQAK